MNKPWGSTNKSTNCHTPVPHISWKKKKNQGDRRKEIGLRKEAIVDYKSQ